jgi:RNA polymerase sigma-70 factor (ECF subfamily)
MSLPIDDLKFPRTRPMETALDSELVALARSGDSSAFETLFTRYYEQIKHYLIRMGGNDATGYELTQETFLRAWQALPSLQKEARFVGWLYQIATNIAHDHQRRARLVSWLPWEKYQEHETVGQAGPETQIEEAELLKAALAQVSLKYRACVVLYIVEELPQAQVAERLNIKASYVSNYVRRGLDELRIVYTRLMREQAL